MYRTASTRSYSGAHRDARRHPRRSRGPEHVSPHPRQPSLQRHLARLQGRQRSQSHHLSSQMARSVSSEVRPRRRSLLPSYAFDDQIAYLRYGHRSLFGCEDKVSKSFSRSIGATWFGHLGCYDIDAEEHERTSTRDRRNISGRADSYAAHARRSSFRRCAFTASPRSSTSQSTSTRCRQIGADEAYALCFTCTCRGARDVDGKIDVDREGGRGDAGRGFFFDDGAKLEGWSCGDDGAVVEGGSGYERR